MGSHYYDSIRNCEVCKKPYDTWDDYEKFKHGFKYLCELCRQEIETRNRIQELILPAYSEEGFDDWYDERLILSTMDKTHLIASDNKDINYYISLDEDIISPIVKFLKDKGFEEGTYASLQGYKFTFRLFRELEIAQSLINKRKFTENPAFNKTITV